MGLCTEIFNQEVSAERSFRNTGSCI